MKNIKVIVRQTVFLSIIIFFSLHSNAQNKSNENRLTKIDSINISKLKDAIAFEGEIKRSFDGLIESGYIMEREKGLSSKDAFIKILNMLSAAFEQTIDTSETSKSDTVARGYNININKEKINLPNGFYVAWWSGYEMEIEVPNKQSLIVKELLQGVRGMNVKIVISVKDGYISVVTKSEH